MEENLLNLSQTISQDEIYNFFGGIDLEKIFSKKTYPVWTFTNEDLKELSKLTYFQDKEIFAILGSGDQVINFFSRGAKLVVACDNRDLACLFVEFKISTLRNLNFKEFKGIFSDINGQNSKIYFEKIRPDLSFQAKKLFDYLFEGVPRNIFLTLKNSKFFYNESWYFLKKKNWLVYLNNAESFSRAKKGISHLSILNTDLEGALKNLKRKFDLIYTSNIFESKKYCDNQEKVLTQLDLHLKEKGEMIILTQDSPQKIVSFLEKLGYNFKIKEPKKSFWQILSKTYPYYYLLARKK